MDEMEVMPYEDDVERSQKGEYFTQHDTVKSESKASSVYGVLSIML